MRDGDRCSGELAFRMKQARKSVLPGFGLTMGYTIVYLSLIALIPLSTILLKTAGMGWRSVLARGLCRLA